MKYKLELFAISLVIAICGLLWSVAQAADQENAASCCSPEAACCTSGAACCEAGIQKDAKEAVSKGAADCCAPGAPCCAPGASCCG